MKDKKKKMQTQLDFTKARDAKDEAILRVHANADPEWIRDAGIAVIKVVNGGKEFFTTDDVWGTGLRKPEEPRALGSVMNGLARQGIIKKTGQFVSSSQVKRHHAPVAVWTKTSPIQ